ncbi:putative peptide maturation dehydrogenase [Stenotrophomonas sp. Iso1]|uniref:putative peptide maturation dehydrogenase n=1 Tax=Stenotrophomonas sp. Iso1 TaxID=2977283 RepID=UPI0022B77583|nr:putative peptide maturation dehydrogenase [Stenotrophomonas sp. Iso1]
MKVRRCTSVFFEPRESTHFDLSSLLSGGNGLAHTRCWFALAPHLAGELRVSEEEMVCVGRYSPDEWVTLVQDLDPISRRLLEVGLLISDAPACQTHRDADEGYRALHWWPLAAVTHHAARWDAVNSVESMQRLGTDNVAGLLRSCGAPPPATIEREARGPDLPLQRHVPQSLDSLLSQRVTCRNFDQGRPLGQALFSQVLERVFAAQGSVNQGGDVQFLKKHSPSGGSLHATEAYLLIQHVEGISPGLYHYRPVDHSLRPLPSPAMPLYEFACNALAGQHWFAQAPVLVIYAPRIARSHWKYRNHPKAYRALMLDVGHLSQTLYLSATDLGLGAFVTAAINEVQIEQAFGLPALAEGPFAIGGFGWRASTQEIAEFDPTGSVW